MRLTIGVAVIASALAGAAIAKLPPPTPEEVAAAAAKKEKQQAQLELEKEQLAKAQDRVAEYYKRTRVTSGGGSPAAGPTQVENLPKTLKVLPGQAGPQGGREQSAEAHSAPAR